MASRVDGVPPVNRLGDGDAVNELDSSNGGTACRGKRRCEDKLLAAARPEASLKLDPDMAA